MEVVRKEPLQSSIVVERQADALFLKREPFEDRVENILALSVAHPIASAMSIRHGMRIILASLASLWFHQVPFFSQVVS